MNDWAAHGRGAYETLEAARAAMRAKWPDAVVVDWERADDPDAVEVYRPDPLEYLDGAGTLAWAAEGIPATLAEADVPALVQELDDIARADGLALDTGALERHLLTLVAM